MRRRIAIVGLVGCGVAAALAAPAAHAATPTCFGQKATFQVTADNQSEHFTNGPDVVVVTGDFDTVYTKGGNDRVCVLGMAGFVFGGPGNDRLRGVNPDDGGLDGQAGDDLMESATVGYLDGPAVTVDLAKGTATGWGHDTLKNVLVVYGSSHNDVLKGSSAGDSLSGDGGHDTLIGRGGQDGLFNDTGSVTASGGAGPDTISIGPGHSSVDGGSGFNRIVVRVNEPAYVNLRTGMATSNHMSAGLKHIQGVQGTTFNDIIYGNAGVNLLDGDSGDDAIYGLGGNDSLLGGEGTDTLVGGAGSDSADGGNGTDSCDAESITACP